MNEYEELQHVLDMLSEYHFNNHENIIKKSLPKFRELVRKATPMKPIDNACPNCKNEEGMKSKYFEQVVDYDYDDNMDIYYDKKEFKNARCLICGQVLDQDDE